MAVIATPPYVTLLICLLFPSDHDTPTMRSRFTVLPLTVCAKVLEETLAAVTLVTLSTRTAAWTVIGSSRRPARARTRTEGFIPLTGGARTVPEIEFRKSVNRRQLSLARSAVFAHRAGGELISLIEH